MVSSHQKISVIIPARNEEYFLPRCIAALERASELVPDTSVEKIVVINRCTDRTEQIARDAGCLVVHDDSKNLSRIRNAGASRATGNMLVTLDADSLVSDRMLKEVQRALSDSSVVGGGVLMLPDRWSLGIVFTMLPLIAMALWYRISGGLFFLRREDFIRLGGFDEALTSAEDVDFARRLRALGRETNRRFKTIVTAHIVTSCRKFDILGDWFAWKNPAMVYRLFQGKDQEAANRIWYDIGRNKTDGDGV